MFSELRPRTQLASLLKLMLSSLGIVSKAFAVSFKNLHVNSHHFFYQLLLLDHISLLANPAQIVLTVYQCCHQNLRIYFSFFCRRVFQCFFEILPTIGI